MRQLLQRGQPKGTVPEKEPVHRYYLNFPQNTWENIIKLGAFISQETGQHIVIKDIVMYVFEKGFTVANVQKNGGTLIEQFQEFMRDRNGR